MLQTETRTKTITNVSREKIYEVNFFFKRETDNAESGPAMSGPAVTTDTQKAQSQPAIEEGRRLPATYTKTNRVRHGELWTWRI